MPELPEVETIVRNYRPLLEGRRILRYVSRWPKQASPSMRAVQRGVAGRRIVRLHRRAKYIVADLDPGHLLIHLRMSGRFAWSADHDAEPPHVRAIFELDRGDRLWFCDARKFGKVVYARDLAAATAHLGAEPLERAFTARAFAKLIRGRQRQLKPLLLDQSVIAGLGNVYVDEALFRARLHPEMRSNALSDAQLDALYKAIRAVLREAIRRQGTTIDWVYPGGDMQERLRVYGRAGEPCTRCGAPIERLVVGQRGTHICPCCQRIHL